MFTGVARNESNMCQHGLGSYTTAQYMQRDGIVITLYITLYITLLLGSLLSQSRRQCIAASLRCWQSGPQHRACSPALSQHKRSLQARSPALCLPVQLMRGLPCTLADAALGEPWRARGLGRVKVQSEML